MTDKYISDPLVPALLSVEATARVLGIGRSKTWDLIKRGDIPSVQIDGSRRVRVRDLEAYVAALGDR
jgi:excisionase family DNA binding protein